MEPPKLSGISTKLVLLSSFLHGLFVATEIEIRYTRNCQNFRRKEILVDLRSKEEFSDGTVGKLHSAARFLKKH
jgi:hypothetical protein